MSARLVLAFAVLIASAVAWPTATFVSVKQYNSQSDCTAGTATPTITYGGLGICTVNALGGSSKVDYVSGSTTQLQTTTYTGVVCAAPGTVQPGNITIGSCSGGSLVTVLDTSVGLYSLTTFSDTGCTTPLLGPQFSMQGCATTLGISSSITVGSKLTVCVGSSCDDTSNCQSLSHSDATCVSGGVGGLSYDWNAAVSATPAVALSVALMALVATAMKF